MRVLLLVGLLVIVPALEAGKYNPTRDLGDAAPAWKDLPGTDGKKHSFSDLKDKDFVLVVFHSCSCPVAEDYERRVIDLAAKYGGEKGRLAVVAINVSKLEEDRLPAMKARAEQNGFTFPYLFDESQQIAKEYGALWTPEFFLLDKDRKIVFMGGMDDSSNVETIKHRYLEPAIEALLSGGLPDVAEAPAIGCRIRFERVRRKPAEE